MITRRLWLVATVALSCTFTSATTMAQTASKEITIVLKEALDGADPCNMTPAIYGNVYRQNVIESLVVLDPTDSAVQPRLATSWEQLDGGTWRFKLREGVKFHDGAPFNASAVVKTIERLMNPALTCLDRGKGPFTKLTAKAIDEYTVDITPDPARVLLPALMTFVGMSSPNTSTTELVRQPVGTGPYIFKSWDPSKEIILERFPEYWGEKPSIERAHYVWRSDSSIRAAMVKVGEADLALDIAPQDATEPHLDFSFLSGDTTRIRIANVPPLDDVRLRKALNLSFDREPLIGTVLSKDAVAATQFMLPKIKGYNPDLKVWPYDPEQAKKLLEEARADGVAVDTEIKLIGRTGFYPNGEEIIQAMAQMWRDVGFNIKLEMVEAGQWLKLVNKPYAENRPAMLIQEMHDNNNGDAEFTMHNRFTTKGKSSEFLVPSYDKLVEEARDSTGEKREKLYQEANRIVAEEIVAGVPMYHMVSFMRIGDRLDFKPVGFYSGLLELQKIKLKQSN